MKCLYWRPQKVSRRVLLLIGLMSLAGLVAVEGLPTASRQPDYSMKLAAAQLAHEAMSTIKQERLERGHSFSRRFDPTESGLVGEAMTPVTSLPASLEAKQTSVNPNFAAAIVEILVRAGVRHGDCVAVGYSGSFPAINVCLCAAMETMKLKPIIISSAASSQFGANVPDFLWQDMEHLLWERRMISFRSAAASLGGFGDRGRGMAEPSRNMLAAAIQRNTIPLLEPATLAEAIELRMQVYRDHSHDRRIKAYINVGGGAASIRGSKGKELYPAGLTLLPPAGAANADSVMTRFAQQATPVINLAQVQQLAVQHRLPIAPAVLPAAGSGDLFVRSGPNRWLAAAVLMAILGALRGFVLSGEGFRLLSRFRRRGACPTIEEQPEILPLGRSELQLMV